MEHMLIIQKCELRVGILSFSYKYTIGSLELYMFFFFRRGNIHCNIKDTLS